MAFNHFGSSRKEKSNASSNIGISHSSIHESKHKKNFHSSIHDHKKIHEAKHLGNDRIINPFNHGNK